MNQRVGLGFDVHPFSDDVTRPLVLGGVHIPDAPGLVGHSDADAVAHAVADSLLGVTGLGDLGSIFPASDPAYRNADSMSLLREVAARVAATGWAVGNVDVVIAAERPKLAPYCAAMATNVCAALAACAGIPVNRELTSELTGEVFVSVRPKRGEGLGFVGRAEGIAVWANAFVTR